ncbi:MAG: hypothetical protein MUF82_04615 [Bacteroidetes bacterium]|jgi:hypothetical protein|nr:hypothetical protein [Bacteroidota bacterium]
MTTPPDDTNGFRDLGSIDRAHVVTGTTRGNLIRHTSIAPSSKADPAAATEPSHSHAPEVVIHRNGESIESIEFICTCGQHAVVNLEYDDE